MDLLQNVLRGFFGLAVLLGICYLFSENRKAINWQLVGMGILLQLILAVGVLHIDFVRSIFEVLARGFVRILDVSKAGTDFVFGKFADTSQSWGFVFAIQVSCNIIFFSAISALLYYLGILQKVVFGFAWIMNKTLKLSGAESVSNAANIFLGQTEAPLMVRPYLSGMTRSEFLCIMVGGMANTAGSVLGAYVSFLGGTDVALKEYYALHMLTQSIMSAPAAVVAAKILLPQVEEDKVQKDMSVPKENIGSNVLDAIANGTTDGLKLAANVIAMLISFIALIAVLNYLMLKIGNLVHINTVIQQMSGGHYEGFSLKFIFGYLFAPLAWVIGVPATDVLSLGQLLGEKTIINEFYAYGTLGGMMSKNEILDPKSILIATYALCGFANFASIGIQIGGIGALAPNQRHTLSELGMKSLIGGTIACLMNACIAGMLFSK
ncbi:MAG: nucleoside transporter C-terminal domain-containing protein [Saprospiraceae bacterium]